LVVFGLKFWFKITSDAPKDAVVVEITGHQFAWEMRYPGKDGKLGKKNFKLYNNPSGNILGVDFEDPESWDDLHTNEMHIPVNRPVKLVIHAMDVIHDVGLSHFRMKMDAVPGIPTTMWFTPIYTTEEMKVRTGNPNFVYEISCDQMCGQGHFSMKGIIVVETQENYEKWLASQTPEYFTLFPAKNPNKPQVEADSTKAKPLAALKP
jgi:cytochrome c oxidase subunit 2